jgi:hypothetical protein
MDLLDEASVEELADLLSDEVLSLHGLLPWLLSYRLGVWADLQMVLNHFPGDPRHLRRFPGEHVYICPEESDERVFLFLSQTPRDEGGLGGPRSDLDGLHRHIVRIGWASSGYLRCLLRHLRTRGRGAGPLRLVGVHGESIEPLNRGDGCGAVRRHSDDTCGGRHLQDHIPIMGNGHEAVEGRSAKDGIEREVNLRNVELDGLRAEVIPGPERDRERDRA